MRHTITILLQNEAGALTRVAGLFSSRGYNIDSLHVAPTPDASVSRLTLVTLGSDEVIGQICSQLLKLVDVVSLVDMTHSGHIERELLLVKMALETPPDRALQEELERLHARILDDRCGSYTFELTTSGHASDSVIELLESLGNVISVVRSGTMAIARGAPALG